MDAEKKFIDAWNAGKVHRVSDGAKPWVGLTDEEMLKCNLDENGWMIDRETAKRNVEAKLKEKNT
jgi:hypothetical protein